MAGQDIANQIVTILNYTYAKEVPVKNMCGLWNDKPNKSCKQSYADHSSKSSNILYCMNLIWRTGRLQSRQKHNRRDYKLENNSRETYMTTNSSYKNDIDFRKAFDKVLHEGLWKVMNDHNVDSNIIKLVKSPYQVVESAVMILGNIGLTFRTMVRVCQGCILSLTVFNLYPENIMKEASLQFQLGRGNSMTYVFQMTLLTRSKEELQIIINHTGQKVRAYKMVISHKNAKWCHL